MRSNPKYFQILILIVVLFESRVRSDKTCEKIRIDAITPIDNKTFAIFRKSDVWLWNKQSKEMTGPCPLESVFSDELKGPVDAAVTIVDHQSIVEFIGATVLFENRGYFTYKNLKPYVVEWGSLEYIPRKGLLKQIATPSEKAQKILEKTKIISAYYDPSDSTTKLVFADLSVMSLTFTFGIEFEDPIISTLSSELSKFGVDLPSLGVGGAQVKIGAVLSAKMGKNFQMYLFSDDKYCSFEMKTTANKQKCDFKPIAEFFECKHVKVSNVCVKTSKAVDADKPIEVAVNPESPNSNTPGVVAPKPGTRSVIGVRSGLDEKPEMSKNQSNGQNVDFLLLVYLLILMFAFNFF